MAANITKKDSSKYQVPPDEHNICNCPKGITHLILIKPLEPTENLQDTQRQRNMLNYPIAMQSAESKLGKLYKLKNPGYNS